MASLETRPIRTGGTPIAVALLAGSLIAVALGVYGKVHDPQFFSVNVAGFSSGTAVKTWMATLALGLALFQFASAFAMYGLLPRSRSPCDRRAGALPLPLRLFLLRCVRREDAAAHAQGSSRLGHTHRGRAGILRAGLHLAHVVILVPADQRAHFLGSRSPNAPRGHNR
jgi:hypothetical protein